MNQQKSILGKTTGSVQNYLMGNNSSKPEIGKGATVLMWTDRYTYEVMRVSKDGTKVIVQQYLPERIDKLGMTDSGQQYKYEKLNGVDKYIVWRNNAWRWEEKKIIFTEAGLQLGFDERQALMGEEELKLVPGLTKVKFSYPVVNILWGVKDEYYDYSH